MATQRLGYTALTTVEQAGFMHHDDFSRCFSC
jgi:hypothetical protein